MPINCHLCVSARLWVRRIRNIYECNFLRVSRDNTLLSPAYRAHWLSEPKKRICIVCGNPCGNPRSDFPTPTRPAAEYWLHNKSHQPFWHRISDGISASPHLWISEWPKCSVLPSFSFFATSSPAVAVRISQFTHDEQRNMESESQMQPAFCIIYVKHENNN